MRCPRTWIGSAARTSAPNQIVEGKVLRIDDEFVLVDVGYKSEGIIPRNEWEEGDEPPEDRRDDPRARRRRRRRSPGRQDDRGMIVLSKRKAEKIEKWMKVMETVHEGDVVTGKVTRKIKGGLLVDIGVNVFLPASQVDIRRPHDIGEYIGKTIECLVLKIDEARRNIVVSRRSLIEAAAGREEGRTAQAARSRPAPQGRRQEHRRLRRVRRPGRHRRPAAHHRHELGPHQPPVAKWSRSTTRSK